MAKVIQIRDVPVETHEALTRAAEAEGLSLTRYLLRELEHVARRGAIAEHNAAVARRTQALVGNHPDRETILDVLHEGRG